MIYLKSRYDLILGKSGVRQYAKCIMMYGPRRCGKTHYLIDRVKEIPEEYSVCFVSFIDKIAQRVHKDNGFGKNIFGFGCRSFDRYSRGHTFDYVFWDDFDFVHNSFNRNRIFELIDVRVKRQLMVSVTEKNDFNYKSWEFREVPVWEPTQNRSNGFIGVSGYTGSQGITGISGYSGMSGYSGQSGTSGYSGMSGIRGH